MTSGVLAGPSSPDELLNQVDATHSVDGDAGAGGTRGGVPDVVRRRLERWRDRDPLSWVAITAVVLVAAALRLVNLASPKGKLFDEVYYAIEGNQMLKHLVEFDVKVQDGVETEMNQPRFVVHPPLGKWCIALGEKLFGYNEFGWRIVAVVFGVASILVMTLAARRMFRSTLLGCGVGLLMSLDGMHFVLSRTAILDIFLMSFLVFAFACLVLDRDRRREKWLVALEGGLDPNQAGRAGRPRFGFPGWRLAAAVLTGCAAAVKWSAIWYILTFLLLMLLWEAGTRRSAGIRVPWLDTIYTQTKWLVGFVVIVFGVYLLSWSGWFLTGNGFYRHWLASSGYSEPPVIGPLINLWHYHAEAFHFHVTLTSPHTYQSWPWQWLLLGRPVAFYYSGAGPCGAASCASEVLLLGTPVLWWSFLPALALLTWFGIRRRDWRALAIGLSVMAGIVPWFWNELDARTMFYFYALPAEPFLCMAVVYVLAAIATPSPDTPPGSDRRTIGAIVAGAYLLLVALCFAYFYPIYTGAHLTYAQWFTRMWLGNRWI